ncbi:MAG TPA: hypothetical protein VHN37_11970 [Actinomycetota bacterium]|nr:hypothetical protein [Actinomycetota bacterium]
MEAVREPEDLYALPLDEFTAARNELARTLKAEGRGDDAARVKKLKKPPVSAWAVNQLVRDDPDGVERLLDLVDRLKEARSARDIQTLGAQRRELVAKLARRAGELAEAAGHAASPATLQRVTQTLQAGAEDEERELLRRGALADDLAPAGFDAFEGIADLDAFTSAPEPEEDSGQLEELERVAAEAEEEAATLTEEAERAEAAAVAASEKASEARRRAREAREKARRAARSR